VHAPARGRPERAGRVADVELEEVVRQLIVEDRVLGVQPLAVQRDAVAEARGQRDGMCARPALEQVPVLLPRAADEDVAAALEPEPVVVERDASVGAVELLFDDAVATTQRLEGTWPRSSSPGCSREPLR
jgi:hypothetical protein